MDTVCNSFDYVRVGFGQQLHAGWFHSSTAAPGAGGIGNQSNIREAASSLIRRR